jgi:copper transport protein
LLFWLACAFGAPLALVWAPAASAHASLTGTYPVDQSELEKAPSHVGLEFNEPVSPLAFTLISPDGKKTRLDRVQQHDARLSVELPPLSERGSFGLSWRVVSVDGHPVSGTFTFSVGAPGGVAIAGPSQNYGRMAAIWLARVALYAGLFFGIGAALFRAFLTGADQAAGSWAYYVSCLGLLALPFAAALQGLDVLDAPLAAWRQWATWQAAFSTTYGATVGLAAVALCAAMGSLRAASGRARVFALLSLALLGLALASSGHASAAAPQWLARPAVWLHVVAVTLWIGSLAPLLYLLRRDDRASAQTLRRFSSLIVWVVVVIVAAGVTLALLQFDRPQSLWQTIYGRVFLVKMVFLASLLAVAVYNRYRLTSGVLRGDARSIVTMRRFIRIELALAVCILATVAAWRFTPPPRALAEAASAKPAFVHIHNTAAMVEVTIIPPRAGEPASMQLALMSNNLTPLVPKEVTVYFSNVAAGIEPIRRDARRLDDGTWRIDRLDLPSVHQWTIRIDALISDFDRVSLEGKIDLDYAGNHVGKP